MNCAIKGQFYLVVSQSFSINSLFVKFHSKKVWEPQRDYVIIQIYVIMRCINIDKITQILKK